MERSCCQGGRGELKALWVPVELAKRLVLASRKKLKRRLFIVSPIFLFVEKRLNVLFLLGSTLESTGNRSEKLQEKSRKAPLILINFGVVAK
jgi:hypothetical protein